MHEVLVNRLGGLSLPRKSMVKLTDCTDMTLDVYRGRKTTIQQQFSETIAPIVKFHMKHDLRNIKMGQVKNPRWPPLLKIAKTTK